MRLRNLIKSDIKFQIKYGFYTIYAILIVVYILILSLIKGTFEYNTGTILIYSDPASMGLFFMGAIVLLEKSQRVLNSIAISPIKSFEYILSKIISIGIIGIIVGVIIGIASNHNNIILMVIGIFLSSAIFTMCGLIIGANVNSLNKYVIATVPFEIIGFLPPIAYILGYNSKLFMIHPGYICVRFIAGQTGMWPVLLFIELLWIFILFTLTNKVIKKMFSRVGGVRL